MDVALSFAGLIAVGVKIMSALKFAEAKDWLALRNQVGSWLVGIVLVFWGANIQGIQNTVIGDIQIGDMTAPTLLYIGLAIGSTGSLVYDALSSFGQQPHSQNVKPCLLGFVHRLDHFVLLDFS